MAEKPNYAIMRIGKIHSRSVLDAVEWHNTRQIPAGTVEGIGLPEEWTSLTGSYRDRADKILEATGATHEQGKVLAVEVLVTASPEWWANASEETKRGWWMAQYEYAEHLFGPGLLAFTPHLDESTPHAQFVGLPLYHAVKKKTGPKPKDPEKLRKRLEEEAKAPKIWRLSHDAVFGGGPVGLAKRQTEYHGFVAHLGLSRGEDTVGKGLKHVPLKLRSKLLTQEERDIARARVELAEKREVLDHYDVQLEGHYAKLQKQKQDITVDELTLFSDQEKLRLRGERLASQEASLTVRLAALEREEEAARTATQHIDERQNLLVESIDRHEQQKREFQASRDKLDAREIRLDKAEAGMMRRESSVDQREHDVAAREARNQAASDDIRSKKRDLERALAQISILTGVMTGRLTVDWDRNGQPRIARDNLRFDETEASQAPWPSILQTPLRHAGTLATTRKTLAKRMRLMLTKLRARRRNLASRETAVALVERNARAAQAEAQRAAADAAKRIESAAQMQMAADEARKQSEEAKEGADSAKRIADAKIARSERVEAAVAEKRAELAVLEVEVANKQRALTNIGGELEAEQAAVAELHELGKALRTEQAKLNERKKKLETEVIELGSKRQRLIQEQAEIDRTRMNLIAERAKWDRSVSIWNEAVQHGAKIEKRDRRSVIVLQRVAGRQPNIIDADSVDPSVVILLEQKKLLEGAMDATQQLADSLDEQKREFAARYPEHEPMLEKERAEDRRRLQKVWASIEAGGPGR